MENIKINAIDFNQLLPHWMREDTIDASLAESVSSYVHDMAGSMKTLKKWTDEAIESMSEKYLDLLAHELDVTWYLYDAPIDQKREIIRKAKRIHWKIGTKWAIEYVLSIYFVSAHIEEWYEYDGTPGHFKITTEYADLENNTALFIGVLNHVKRFSQVLDSVEMESIVRQTYYPAMATDQTMRNVITDVFSRSLDISGTAYNAINEGGG